MYQLVLFLHLLTIAIAFFAMGTMISSVLRLRAATDVASARAAALAASGVEKVMPVATVLLLLTGAYLTQTRWTWTTPWIDVSIAGLLIVTVFGAGALGGRQRALDRVLTRASALDAATTRLVLDPFLLVGGVADMGLVAGVMFVMVVKPPLFAGIAALIVGAACGAFAGASAIRPAAVLRRVGG